MEAPCEWKFCGQGGPWAGTGTAAAAKSLKLCPTLCHPIDGSPPSSSVPGILQARTLEWVAISFSNAWKWKVKVKSFSRVQLLATPWTAAYQAPPSMGFSRQEYWSGVPLGGLFQIQVPMGFFLDSINCLAWCLESAKSSIKYLINQWMDGWVNSSTLESYHIFL